MPHTRRRKFSVKKNIDSKKCTKNQIDQSSCTDPGGEAVISVSVSKFENNVIASSKNTINLYNVTESNNATSTSGNIKSENINTDVANMSILTKEETLGTINDLPEDHIKELVDMSDERDNRRNLLQNKERYPYRREINPRQHRIKVRSPKRRMVIHDNSKITDTTDSNICNNKQPTGTFAINWKQELDFHKSENIVRNETSEDEGRTSLYSLDDMCRICHGDDTLSLELGRLISACACRGTVGRVHIKCLERWLTESGKSRCELCGTRYFTRRVHRYGVPRALVMWIVSQNAKQLMVDSLGIMLMSPLAVLAAWLSGRTLAGLMQENRVTHWPLASTFVLACMTLVCYYCWVVSAATRHALGWWIWYRSQYEVRLQIQENED